MLRSLHLRDFVIVPEARIEFESGFTALTGETGAGKSILLDALGLTLGERADARLIRDGAQRADLCAEFQSSAEVDERLVALDLAGDPGTLLMRRVIESDGRSRSIVNGHPTTITQAREIGRWLVDIHGQHESQRLMDGAAQRELLDRHGRLESGVAAVGAAFSAWQQAERALESARSGSRERQLRVERLQAEVDEIAALRLAPGEWEALSDEQTRLAHGRELVEGASQAADALARGDRTLADSLRQLQSQLRPLAAIDATLRLALEMLDSALIQIEEAASDLAAYADRSELDPARLAEVEGRVAAIHGTGRRLRIAPQALADHLQAARNELEALGAGGDLAALEARSAEARAAYDRAAAVLSEQRRTVATRLGNEVSKLLERLGMGKARLVVELGAAPASSQGIDAVSFGIAAHARAAPRPIARYASGGELSRVGLAIAALAAADQPVPTLIFDEADAGIGGTVANVVGELMQRLGSDRQVLCVTHLPQVASRADHHLLVTKDVDSGGVPAGRVEGLTAKQRIGEIARMLGASRTSQAHARELLAQSSRRG